MAKSAFYGHIIGTQNKYLKKKKLISRIKASSSEPHTFAHKETKWNCKLQIDWENIFCCFEEEEK